MNEKSDLKVPIMENNILTQQRQTDRASAEVHMFGEMVKPNPWTALEVRRGDDHLCPASSQDVGNPLGTQNVVARCDYGRIASGASHIIEGIYLSYSAAPTGGNLTILDGDVTIFNCDITAAGFLYLPIKKIGTPGYPMSVILSAGAGAVVGRLSLDHRTT